MIFPSLDTFFALNLHKMLQFISNPNCIQDDEVGFAYISQREARPSLYVDPTFQKPNHYLFIFVFFFFYFFLARPKGKDNASINFPATVLAVKNRKDIFLL